MVAENDKKPVRRKLDNAPAQKTRNTPTRKRKLSKLPPMTPHEISTLASAGDTRTPLIERLSEKHPGMSFCFKDPDDKTDHRREGYEPVLEDKEQVRDGQDPLYMRPKEVTAQVVHNNALLSRLNRESAISPDEHRVTDNSGQTHSFSESSVEDVTD